MRWRIKIMINITDSASSELGKVLGKEDMKDKNLILYYMGAG